MAKDGTYRGGRRVKAGSKPDALADKIAAGKEAKILETYDFDPEALFAPDEPEDVSDLFGEEMPSPSDYLSARQKDGKPLGADEIYAETWKWLKDRRCEKLVNRGFWNHTRRLLPAISSVNRRSVSTVF